MTRLILLVLSLLSVAGAFAAVDNELIRVGDDHWSFVTRDTKTRFIPFGSNFVLNEKKYLNLFGPDVYNAAYYEKALAGLEGLGFNIVKVFLPIANVLPDPQVPGDARIAPGYLENLDDFLRLAKKHHIRVEVCLTEWGGNGIKWWHEGGEYFGRKPWKTDDGIDSRDVLCHFWAKLGAHLKGNPTVFSYTPAVEWSFPASNLTWSPPDKQWGRLETEQGLFYWRAFLRAKYKDDLAALNRAYGGAYLSFDDVRIVDFDYDFATKQYKSPDAQVLDYQDFREWASMRYFRPQIAAIRKADPTHMVTISNHMRRPVELWEGSAIHFIGFSETEQSDLVDYLTTHDNHSQSEMKKDDTVESLVRGSILRARFCNARKKLPLIIEELTFGAPDEQKMADVQEAMVRGTVGSASGWMNWYLQYPHDANEADTPNQERSAILKDDLTPTAWGLRAKALIAQLKTMDLSRQASGVIVKADRMKSLAPHELGVAYEVARNWDQYKEPVDFDWPRDEFIDLKLIGER
jgi:hypothetical protein